MKRQRTILQGAEEVLDFYVSCVWPSGWMSEFLIGVRLEGETKVPGTHVPWFRI